MIQHGAVVNDLLKETAPRVVDECRICISLMVFFWQPCANLVLDRNRKGEKVIVKRFLIGGNLFAEFEVRGTFVPTVRAVESINSWRGILGRCGCQNFG